MNSCRFVEGVIHTGEGNTTAIGVVDERLQYYSSSHLLQLMIETRSYAIQLEVPVFPV